MSTPNSSSAPPWPAPRAAGRRPAGPRAGALAVPLLIAGALAAGCAGAQSGRAPGAAHSGGAASGGASSAAPAHSAGPPSSAVPVPTISGGHVAPGQPACAGWPAGARSASLPASFVPVSVERCVNGAQVIPGNGLWTTATLERSDSDLSGLIAALRRPPGTHRPGTVCPEIAVIPQQVVLTDAEGNKLIPRLPVTGCGFVQSQVLAALNALRWRPVSVRLIAKIPDASSSTVPGGAPGTAPATAPHPIQTAGGAGSR